jgi:hypothetical protein
MQNTLVRSALKNSNLSAYAILFGICMLAGGWFGFTAAQIGPQGSPIQPSSHTAIPDAPANGQRNLLVIGVDRLDHPSPRLESAWLVVYFPGRTPITFLPLYPQAAGEARRGIASLDKSFELTETGLPGESFFEQLSREQILWNHVLVLDELGLVGLLDYLGGVQLHGQFVDGKSALEETPRAWQDQEGAVAGQNRLLQAACLQAGSRFRPKDALQFLQLVGDHLRSDVDLSELIQDWFSQVEGEPVLRCEFPLNPAPYP